MASIDSKITNWSNKLLDLGKRNRLVSYKDTKISTIKITEPTCIELYNHFVVDENAITFPKETYKDGEWIIENDSFIKTDKSPADLPRALRNIRNKAKTSLEERGINMLYLSFGFLRYNEAAYSNIDLYAPLILVPVTLSIASIVDPYVLSLHEDEVVVNPTLAYKLETEFGISLPSFDNTDDLEGYLESVREIVKVNGWDVVENVALGLLSFLKINMYNDLKKHESDIKENDIVRAISGDTNALESISKNVIDFSNYDFDGNEDPKTVFQIVDADSSQQEAILLAKKGASFVLQGPPGTGKSQTITNIIAESLASGKKVLFVSEKQAALEVVRHRLELANLADFCLVLHSYKANKKSVLNQLESMLDLTKKKATLADEAYQRLVTLNNDRKELNQYVKQLHTIVEPLKKSVFEVNGILAKLEDYPNLIFDIPDIRELSREDLSDIEYTLQKYVYIVKQSTIDYKHNPWRYTKLRYISNEYRHDAGAYLPLLKESLLNAIKTVNLVNEKTKIGIEPTFDGVQAAVNLLEPLSNSYVVPSGWIHNLLLDDYKKDIEKGRKQQERFNNTLSLFKSKSKGVSIIRDDESLETLDQAVELKNRINSFIISSGIFSIWEDIDLNKITKWIDQIDEKQQSILNCEKQILQDYDEGIFSIDYKGILSRIRTEYTSFFKYFKTSYKEDKKQFAAYKKAINSKIQDSEMLSITTTLEEREHLIHWFDENRDQLNSLFGENKISSTTDINEYNDYYNQYRALKDLLDTIEQVICIFREEQAIHNLFANRFINMYQGLRTNWDTIEKALLWAIGFKRVVSKYHPSEEFVESACSSTENASNMEQQRTLLLDVISIKDSEPFKWFVDSFNNSSELCGMCFNDLAIRIGECNDNFEQLEEWIDYIQAKEKCDGKGLSDFLNLANDENIKSDFLVPVYKKRFYMLWLDSILNDFYAIKNFRRRDQEHRINEFVELDRLQFDIAKSRIRGQLINSLPSFSHFTSGIDEVSILKRELKKQRKIMPIRKLFKAIPNLLLTLKPCLMMSPLSVSLFLEADTYKFDVVVFDEASQVFTENAIGAIIRGKQVIIAGDSKQLPPTNFFQTTISEGEYDSEEDDGDEEDTNIYESILDEANMLPEKTLLWHYRSRHESLIAFSNAKIYKNKLITFPSNIEHASDCGVEYIYVPDGYYDRGGRKGNVIEAKKVAELVFEHFEKTPEKSLGVIAFGEIQQNAIDTEIRAMRLQDPSKEEFFLEDKEEPFFIKSLENVQGDERDTIIFSIGYAKDSNGVFRNQFGPLGKIGGERRLNVAITRAKYNVKLVGSIHPTDIDVDKIKSEGPKLLRSYIDYAINGPEVLNSEITESDIVEHDSPFEETVYNFLDRHGYKLATQVGCSGYRIDMAVKHPTLSGVYVIGIECDGASYHSARNARERDRLRQDVLEGMGWKLYRIWSTDWIKDPASEGARLLQAVEDAIEKYNIEGESGEYSLKKTKLERSDKEFVRIEDSYNTNNPGNSYGFSKVNSYNFDDLPTRNGYLDIKDCIQRVVENEYPIHFERLCQKLAYLYGNEKATVKVRREIEFGLRYMKNRVIQKGDFIYPVSYDEIPIRMPNDRPIQHISIEELSTAMLIILSQCVGTTKQALIDETARAYGFMRTGPKIAKSLDRAYYYLIDAGKVKEIEEKVQIV